MVDVPWILNIPVDFGGVGEAEVDVETWPVIFDEFVLYMIPSMECYLIGSGGEIFSGAKCEGN